LVSRFRISSFKQLFITTPPLRHSQSENMETLPVRLSVPKPPTSPTRIIPLRPRPWQGLINTQHETWREKQKNKILPRCGTTFIVMPLLVLVLFPFSYFVPLKRTWSSICTLSSHYNCVPGIVRKVFKNRCFALPKSPTLYVPLSHEIVRKGMISKDCCQFCDLIGVWNQFSTKIGVGSPRAPTSPQHSPKVFCKSNRRKASRQQIRETRMLQCPRLYGTELGSVTLKRIGFFCFPFKHSTHTQIALVSKT